jgi:hypothetical protein
MLIISNGAEKSGSTWLASIVLQLIDYRQLPAEFHDARHGSIPTIKPALLDRFLREVDYHSHDYVSKNHFYYEYPLLAQFPDVYVLDIDRDLPDTLVSLFFHGMPNAAESTLDDIRRLYWERGAQVVERLVRYHAVWGRPSSWTYTSSYERLSENPRQEIAAIAAFLRQPLSDDTLERIVRETGFTELAAKLSGIAGMERRFRKGVVGDAKNYLDAAIVEDIRRVAALNAGYPRTPRDEAEFDEACRRHIEQLAPAPAHHAPVR